MNSLSERVISKSLHLKHR